MTVKMTVMMFDWRMGQENLKSLTNGIHEAGAFAYVREKGDAYFVVISPTRLSNAKVDRAVADYTSWED